jgi:hypothetical protein
LSIEVSQNQGGESTPTGQLTWPKWTGRTNRAGWTRAKHPFGGV